MCVVRLGGCPIFQKMRIKYLVPGTDLGVGATFFQKLVFRDWYWVSIWGGDVNTFGYMESRVGTRWVSIRNWYLPGLNRPSYLIKNTH